MTDVKFCIKCDMEYPKARHQLGYRTCLSCGEQQAKKVTHCVVPMHKSNYVVVSDIRHLIGINNKC